MLIHKWENKVYVVVKSPDLCIDENYNNDNVKEYLINFLADMLSVSKETNIRYIKESFINRIANL